MPQIIKDGLCFDDVMLVPKHSTVDSRSKVDISVKGLNFQHPIIPANMQTVTGKQMAFEIINSGGLAIIHRFMPIDEQLKIAEDIISLGTFSKFGVSTVSNFAVSVGVKTNDVEYIKSFYEAGVRIMCIDIAHGDSNHCIEMAMTIKEKYPDIFVIAGNVATGAGAERLWRAGADAVKVGVGPGSLCTTRIETGNGVPQLTALMDVADTKNTILQGGHKRTLYVIADGGIKNAGDIVKALCFADMVMVGNLFAGCTEAPGKTHTINGISYKEYVGSSTHKTNHIEGVEALVPCKGPYQTILNKLLEGLRSGCSYQGAHNLEQLKVNPDFIRITNAGLKESHPHDVFLK